MTEFQITATKSVKYKIVTDDSSIAISNITFIALKPKVVHWSAITLIELKKAFASTHVNLVIHYTTDNKQKKITIMMQPFDKQGVGLIKTLKTKLGAKLWKNHLVDNLVTLDPKSYPLTKRMLGQYMSRTMILWVWGILSVGLLPLPYFLYLLLAKGLMVTTTMEGIKVKKVLSRSATWSEIQKMEYSLLSISHRSYGLEVAQSQWGMFTIIKNDGKKIKFSLQTVDAALLVKTMQAHNLLPGNYLDDCVLFAY